MPRKRKNALAAVTAGATITPNPCPIADPFTFAASGLEPGAVYSLKLIDRVGLQFPAATVTADGAGSVSALLRAAWDGTNTVEVWQYAGGDTMDWTGPLASASVEVV